MNFATAWVTTAPSSTRARANQLPLAVRVGGHSAPGHHSCDEGVVIDCRMLDRIEVDFTTGLVRCGSGVTWKQTRAAAETMSTYSDMVSYPNFLSADDTTTVADAYGRAVYARLVGVKNRYDPENVFRINNNIPPSG